MKQLSVNIPGAIVSYNYLYESMPIDWREEDLLFAKLPNGNVIDVGWYPACNPTGRFRITLSDSAQNQIETVIVSTLDQVVSTVEGLSTESGQRPTRETSIWSEYRPLPSSQNSVHAMSSATTGRPTEVRYILPPPAVA